MKVGRFDGLTATGEEVLAVLRRLAVEHGQTVVLVTHDAAIASRASRVIRMRDGLVVAGGSPTAAWAT